MNDTAKMRRLISFLNERLGETVADEEYEIAANLRDAILLIGDYILEYLTYLEIKDVLWVVLSAYGVVVHLDRGVYTNICTVEFQAGEYLDTYYFHLDRETADEIDAQFADLYKKL